MKKHLPTTSRGEVLIVLFFLFVRPLWGFQQIPDQCEDNHPPRFDRSLGDAYIACTDVDTILKYSAVDAVRDPQSCLFSGKTWTLLEQQNVFFINDIYDDCSRRCALRFQIRDRIIRGDVCEGGGMVIRTVLVTDEAGRGSQFVIRFVVRPVALQFNEVQSLSLDACAQPDAAPPVSSLARRLPYWQSAFKNEEGAFYKEYLDERFFGNEYSASLCGQEVAFVDDTVAYDCSGMVLSRQWRFRNACDPDHSWQTGPQQIISAKKSDYVIRFPADAENFCALNNIQDIEINTFGCDVFALSRDTLILPGDGDACFRQWITFRVINWCAYDGQTLEPTLIPRDVDCDGRLDEPTWLKVDDNQDFILDDDASVAVPGRIAPIVEREIQSGDDNFSATTYNLWINNSIYGFDRSCPSGSYPYHSGYWQYTQIIEVFDDEAPLLESEEMTFCANEFYAEGACQAEVVIPFRVQDACSDRVNIERVLLAVNGKDPANLLGEHYRLLDQGGGRYAIQSFPGTTLPKGNHLFYVQLSDYCGNTTNQIIPFRILDCTAPAPVCHRSLTVDLSPVVVDGQITGAAYILWATDLVAADLFDCSPHPQADAGGNVKYYAFKGQIPSTLDSIALETNRTVAFSCADQPVVPVFLAAVDGAGNWDHCVLNVAVRTGSDPDPCEPEPSSSLFVSGLITTESDEPVEKVNVQLEGPFIRSQLTGPNGLFAFTGLEKGDDLSLTPARDDAPLNGVTTFDIVLMSQHVLGAELLDSPYKLIAADINRSGGLTSLDIILLRKLILNVDTEFNNNPSWRFIDADFVFSDEKNPWRDPFPETLFFSNLQNEAGRSDFIGLKVGDVNGSARPNSNAATPRSTSGDFVLKTTVTPGEEPGQIRWALVGEGLEQIEGIQFTLEFDPQFYDLKAIQSGLADEEHIGLAFAGEGLLTFSWNWMAKKRTITSQEELFGLVLQKKSESAAAYPPVRLSSRLLPAEAYLASGKVLAVQIGQGRGEERDFQLFPNYPNPFKESTRILFYLPERSRVRLTVANADGKIIQVRHAELPEGKHEFLFRDLPPGVLYYTLSGEGFSISRRMLSVR